MRVVFPAVVSSRRFVAVVEGSAKRAHVPVPFEPDEVWGEKPRHHVAGTVGGVAWRGPIDTDSAESPVLRLGAAWLRDCQVVVGSEVEVVLAPEGPQRGALAEDVAAALEASPAAAAFFDSLAQFYRKGYLTWVDATKRSPELRAQRIAGMVKDLEAGRKQRSRG